ncbi:hypothetical protein DPEC_G00041620 [Dallia pectoralis]|uniref:Uncharacterized protein n=1 Tax=Dallia pectoralis TaxID=75939 RepID=A0ACC2HFX0_DALPE|nr:hypothetical protein DPEC_G00041620 [Dallia pectoralis]
MGAQTIWGDMVGATLAAGTLRCLCCHIISQRQDGAEGTQPASGQDDRYRNPVEDPERQLQLPLARTLGEPRLMNSTLTRYESVRTEPKDNVPGAVDTLSSCIKGPVNALSVDMIP